MIHTARVAEVPAVRAGSELKPMVRPRVADAPAAGPASRNIAESSANRRTRVWRVALIDDVYVRVLALLTSDAAGVLELALSAGVECYAVCFTPGVA